MPATLVLPDSAVRQYRQPVRSDAWSEIVPPEDLEESPIEAPRRASASKPVKRRRRRGGARRALASAVKWLSALTLGLGILAAAGLLLQYRGLPWMPAQVAERIPPWLVNLFR